MAFAGIHGRQFGNFGLGLFFAAASYAGRGAIIFNQGLVGGEIVGVEFDRGFEFLLRFFGKGQCGKPGGVRGFFSQGPAQPFVVDGIVGRYGEGFFGAAGSGIVLAKLEVAFGEQ